jgi:predicted amidohydrolase
MNLRIAAAQFAVFAPASWEDYEQRFEILVHEAATSGAQLLAFPEYASLVLAAIDTRPDRTPSEEVTVLQGLRDAYLALHRKLATRHQVYLLAGSFPWEVRTGRFHNRAWLCSPDGGADFQDKLIMTRFEREEWNISAGSELKVFTTALGRVGVDICYDIEFPLLARTQAEAGAQLLLAPSCTDTLAGFHRVRIGAQARALENQCIVVQAPLVGDAAWSAAIDVNVGSAGIYGPPDRGFPNDGVLASGRMNEACWVYADVDLSAVETVRSTGQVLNHRHWREQLTPGFVTAAVHKL